MSGAAAATTLAAPEQHVIIYSVASNKHCLLCVYFTLIMFFFSLGLTCYYLFGVILVRQFLVFVFFLFPLVLFFFFYCLHD